MDANQARLKQNIARIRRDIRKASREMQDLVDADLDCTGAARALVHLQNGLRLFLKKQECGNTQRVEDTLSPCRVTKK